MGSTNKTAHYELPQFVANDKPSWLGDVNQAMEAIDTGIFGAKSSADGAQTTANNAVAGVQTANTRMDGMQTQLDTVATQANQTATAVNQHTASIATNSANINTLNSRMGNTDISDIGDGTVTGAIEAISGGGGGGGASNVRWNATTDRFEVLKNGNWVQSIRAFVNSIAVLVNGILASGVENGVYNATPNASSLSGGGHNPFIVSGGVLVPTTAVNSGSTLVFGFDATNYNSVKIRYGASEKTLNVSDLSGTVYVCLYSYIASTTQATNSLKAYISTAKENFENNAAQTESLLKSVEFSSITVSQITIE